MKDKEFPVAIQERRDFWVDVFAIKGSVTPYVIKRVLVFGLVGLAVWLFVIATGLEPHVGIAPYEVVGAVITLLLVLRTNSGYDRWYEARKLWGGIVNQTRNLGVMGLTYGPDDPAWRSRFIRWVASFAHASRHSLRGEDDISDIRALVGNEQGNAVARAQHMPLFVSCRLGAMLRSAMEEGQMDRFAFLAAEKERASLIDHIGACERILKTPLARVFSIKIRRFLFLFLATLPIALVDKTGSLTPLITMLAAYPLVALDQVGIELQNPFSRARLSHLPLTEICAAIQENLFGMLESPDLANSFATSDGLDAMTEDRRAANIPA